jgi:hypothetical protein
MKGKAGALLKVQARGDLQEDRPRRSEKEGKSGKSYSAALIRTGFRKDYLQSIFLGCADLHGVLEQWSIGKGEKSKKSHDYHYSITPVLQ